MTKLPKFDRNYIMTESHVREHGFHLDHDNLIKLLTGVFCHELGLNPNSKNLKIDIKFKDQMAGSPEYKVGTKVSAKIIEDLQHTLLMPNCDAPDAAWPDPPGGSISGT